MRHETTGEPGDEVGDVAGDVPGAVGALFAALDKALDPPGPLDWDRVMRDVWFGVDRDPDAPTPRDVVDRDPASQPDDRPPV